MVMDAGLFSTSPPSAHIFFSSILVRREVLVMMSAPTKLSSEPLAVNSMHSAGFAPTSFSVG